MRQVSEPPPPAPLLAAIRLLAAGDSGCREAFDRVLATEAAPVWRALALLGRGFAEELAGSPSAARSSARAALELWASENPAGSAVVLAALGRALAESRDGELSAAFLAAARRLSKGQPAEVIGGVLIEAGAAAAELGEAGGAAAHWRQALAEGDPLSRAAAAANLGRLAAARGDGEAALGLFDQAAAVDDGSHLGVIADGLVALAAQAAAEERWDETDARLRQALPLRQAVADSRGVAEVLHDLGIAHWRRGQLQAATRCLEDCRYAAEGLGDEPLRAAALRALARVSLDAARPVIALAYGREAARAAQTADERRAAAAVLQEVGEEARRRGAGSLGGEAFRTAAQLLADIG
jgi:tetratricopeptide (TPR) repeat protein